MTGFPRVPLIRGDTDDDASIHLHTHVGPARPMTKRNYDRQIMEILKRRPLHNSSDNELEFELDNLNAQFERYAKQRRPSFSDGEKTETEDEPVPKLQTQKPKRKVSMGVKSPPQSAEPKFQFTDLRVLGFIIGIISLLLIPYPRLLSGLPSQKSTPDTSDVTSRIELVEQRVTALDDITSALSNQADFLESKQEAFIASISGRIDSITRQFDSIPKELTVSDHYTNLTTDFTNFKNRLQNIEFLIDDSHQLEENLSAISDKIQRLSQIGGDLNSFKSSIVKSFIDQLPNYVPVYIKNKKVHYLPEFQRFLQAFIDDLDKKGNSSAELSNNCENLEQMVRKQAVKEARNAFASFVSKNDLQKILYEKLAERDELIASKLNALVDTIDLSKNLTRVDVAHNTNKVMLDNLIDIVSKGSVKINFADYKNGARILGFLTSRGESVNKRRSIASRVLFGWYDYFSSHGLHSPEKLNFDANNVLFDLGTYWTCDSNICSIGVRLSSPVVLTDLVFKNPSLNNPGISPPIRASIFIKPSKKSEVPVVEEYLRRTKPENLAAGKSNKYLTKFYKVQEVSISSKAIQHVKLPVSLVNLNILVRDIYIEISTREGRTGLFNLKAYGLTEFNSFSYAEEFESILDKLQDEPEDVDDYFFEDGKVLGDDDYI